MQAKVNVKYTFWSKNYQQIVICLYLQLILHQLRWQKHVGCKEMQQTTVITPCFHLIIYVKT